MLKIVVCLKQVPRVSELPWDARTGTIQRDLAEGMMNPDCRAALEAALALCTGQGGEITAITMGPPTAEEVLYEAIALGANRGVLLTDPRMAGADTSVTAYTLARAIERTCAGFDLILCGYATTDSETAQVGQQLAEELAIPGVACVSEISVLGRTVQLKRRVDNFLETLEMDLPGLITVTAAKMPIRYVSLGGIQAAFTEGEIVRLNADLLDLKEERIGSKGSPTRILNVTLPTAAKKNLILTGTPKRLVMELLNRFDDKIGGAIGKDLKADDMP